MNRILMLLLICSMIFLPLLDGGCTGADGEQMNQESPQPGGSGNAKIVLEEARADYAQTISVIDTMRADFKDRYLSADTDSSRAIVLDEASRFLETSLEDSIWPPWMGTPWDMYGTTQVPREGEIACGYFVTITLRDVGFDLPWIELAQLASEYMIRRLANPESVRRYSRTPPRKFLSDVSAMGDGVYIVGLDQHVGFLVVQDTTVSFCHSSYVHPYCVTFEPAMASGPLVHSGYRVVGKIIPVDRLTEAWLLGDRIAEE